MKTCYLSGPMRGYPQFNFPAFDAGKKILEEIGFNVISPADLDRETGFDPASDGYDFDVAAAMKRDIAAILECDAMAFLPGWERSKGAQAEKAVAESLNLPLYKIDPAVPGVIVELEVPPLRPSHLPAERVA